MPSLLKSRFSLSRFVLMVLRSRFPTYLFGENGATRHFAQ